MNAAKTTEEVKLNSSEYRLKILEDYFHKPEYDSFDEDTNDIIDEASDLMNLMYFVISHYDSLDDYLMGQLTGMIFVHNAERLKELKLLIYELANRLFAYEKPEAAAEFEKHDHPETA